MNSETGVRGPESDRERIYRMGLLAWKRLKRDKTWADWMTVGEALTVAREEAINRSRSNTAMGSAYNKAFGIILVRIGLDDMDKGDRSRLFQCLEYREDIEGWRKTLTTTERLSLNHPSSVWRKFKKAHAGFFGDPFGEPKETKSPIKQSLEDSNQRLHTQIADYRRENDELKARVAELGEELEHARETPRDLVGLIEATIATMHHTTEVKVEEGPLPFTAAALKNYVQWVAHLVEAWEGFERKRKEAPDA